MKAIAFIYSWSGRRELDPYFGQVAAAFGALGINLQVVLSNELLHPNGDLRTLHPFVDESRLLDFVAQERPDFLFSVNNAGMTARLEEACGVPIIKWLVDDVPHLFFHDGVPDPRRLFGAGARVICYSSTLAAQIGAVVPQHRARIAWVSHGTNLFRSAVDAPEALYPISFVGTCLDHQPFVRVLQAARKRGAASQVLDALEAVRADYVRGNESLHETVELRATLREAGFSTEHFKRILADLLTTQNRIEGLRHLVNLGLHLFGNDLWFNSLCATSDLTRRFEFSSPVNNYDKLLATYAQSRISVNIPNVQNYAGLAVRVFDTMASPSLLITEYHPDSDLFRLFGPDCPVPMYRNFDHLRSLCVEFLNDEGKRQEVVARCNRLIDERFLIAKRLTAMLDAGGVARPGKPDPANPFSIVDTRRFYAVPKSLKRLGPFAALATKQVLKGMLTPLARAHR